MYKVIYYMRFYNIYLSMYMLINIYLTELNYKTVVPALYCNYTEADKIG